MMLSWAGGVDERKIDPTRSSMISKASDAEAPFDARTEPHGERGAVKVSAGSESIGRFLPTELG
ncbi:hypothetical protein [Kineococcus gypseus]|uniref:hypothetical protein n=1 Tax=Kineococcus gypseus TaxID=1637102 RepID=UPI003D7CB361